MKKHRLQSRKLEFLIKWLSQSNRQNTWEPKDHLAPALVQEYFQQSLLEKPALTNTVFITKILTKKPSITWRCYIPLPLVLVCLFILWSSLRKAQTVSVPALNLGPIYDCSQPRHLGIFVFPSLKNYSHNMLQKEAIVSRFLGKVFHYSPIAVTFPIYYCTLETITMTYHYDNIFMGESRCCKVKSVLLPGRSCLQAGLNHTVPIGCHNKTLTNVTDNHWKIPVSLTYDCSFSMTIVNTYHNFHMRTCNAQLVGAANVIGQHLTNTPCSATIDTTLNIGSCILQETSNHIIVRGNPHHKRQEMNTLGIHESKQRGCIFSYPPYTLAEPFKRNLDPRGEFVNWIMAW